MIPAQAVEAACDAVSESKGKLKFEDAVRLALEAAAPHMGEMEWGVFRSSDGEDGTPVEGFRYPSREAAQKSIDGGYTQPQFWEPRGRVVGKWTTNAV